MRAASGGRVLVAITAAWLAVGCSSGHAPHGTAATATPAASALFADGEGFRFTTGGQSAQMADAIQRSVASTAGATRTETFARNVEFGGVVQGFAVDISIPKGRERAVERGLLLGLTGSGAAGRASVPLASGGTAKLLETNSGGTIAYWTSPQRLVVVEARDRTLTLSALSLLASRSR